ncbi:MAG: hypothetical protein RMM17_13830 [Acidobacteriota bacterium]|nr:hypothetical protein [Blastocatellia bacterium]MDW8413747.1 hypothetical protein [Acidobacteriota bacterium]
MKKSAVILLIAGALLIIAGVILKRSLNMGQYLVFFHAAGGLSMAVGFCLWLLAGEKKA